MGTADAPLTAYHEVLYAPRVYPQTHPKRLAAIGFLRGMSPASVDHCRVLELASGDGSNLIGTALHWPRSGLSGSTLRVARPTPLFQGSRMTNKL